MAMRRYDELTGMEQEQARASMLVALLAQLCEHGPGSLTTDPLFVAHARAASAARAASGLTLADALLDDRVVRGVLETMAREDAVIAYYPGAADEGDAR